MNITTSQTGAVMTFDSQDWIAGLAPNGKFSSSVVSPAMGAGAIRIQNINSFTNYGVLQPGKTGTDVTNFATLLGVVVSGVVQGSTYAYLLDGGGRISQFNYTNQTITAAGTITHTITGTTPVGQDIVMYKHNVGGTPTFSMFYSYYNTANWDVGTMNATTPTTYDDNYMSTVPADFADMATESTDSTQDTSPHCLEVGTDDVLYMGSGRYIHAYDGATGAEGTFIAKVLSLPLGFTIIALKKFQDKMLIAGNYNVDTSNSIGGEALLYVWNYIDLDITQAIPLEDPAVVSLFLWQGRPHVITVGEVEGRGINKLKILNGNEVDLIESFDLKSPINRGIDASSSVLYINCGGRIVQIGDPFLGGTSVHEITFCVTSSFSGWVKNFGVDPSTTTPYGLMSSSGSAFSGGTNSFCQTNLPTSRWSSAGQYITPYYEIPLPVGKRARLMNVIVEHFRTFTLADFSFGLDYDFGITSSQLFSNQATLTAPLTKQYKYDSANNPLKYCTSIRPNFTWSGITPASQTTAPPAITRLTLVFEYADLLQN